MGERSERGEGKTSVMKLRKIREKYAEKSEKGSTRQARKKMVRTRTWQLEKGVAISTLGVRHPPECEVQERHLLLPLHRRFFA